MPVFTISFSTLLVNFVFVKLCLLLLSLGSVISSFAFQPELFRKFFTFSSNVDFWEANFWMSTSIHCGHNHRKSRCGITLLSCGWQQISHLQISGMLGNIAFYIAIIIFYFIIFFCLPFPSLDVVILWSVFCPTIKSQKCMERVDSPRIMSSPFRTSASSNLFFIIRCSISVHR